MAASGEGAMRAATRLGVNPVKPVTLIGVAALGVGLGDAQGAAGIELHLIDRHVAEIGDLVDDAVGEVGVADGGRDVRFLAAQPDHLQQFPACGPASLGLDDRPVDEMDEGDEVGDPPLAGEDAARAGGLRENFPRGHAVGGDGLPPVRGIVGARGEQLGRSARGLLRSATAAYNTQHHEQTQQPDPD